MKNTGSFSFRARAQSFNYALEGIKTFLKEEHNARIHLAATVIVVVLSFTLPIARVEVIALSLSMGFVWVTEIFNTTIERALDFISTERDSRIKLIKDLSAAAVLIAAVVAFVTVLLIFIPKILVCIN